MLTNRKYVKYEENTAECTNVNVAISAETAQQHIIIGTEMHTFNCSCAEKFLGAGIGDLEKKEENITFSIELKFPG